MTSGRSHFELLPGEQEVAQGRAAGHVEARGYMAGGRLRMTNRRLIWVPSGFARRASSSTQLELQLSEVSKIEIVPRPFWPLIGGMRRRLAVHMRDGREHQFMLTTGGLDAYAKQLEASVAQAIAAGSSPESGRD